MNDRFLIQCGCGFKAPVPEFGLLWNENETCDCPVCGNQLEFNRSISDNKYARGYCFYEEQTND